LKRRGAFEVAEMVREGKWSARSVVMEALSRIDAVEGSVHAFLHVDREGALRRAEEIDRAVAEGRDPGPLAGVPVAVKDNISVEGMPLTCGSRILEGYVAPYDATVVRRLREAGAIIIGKTNLDEFAMGSSTEYSAYGPTRNPWDLSRIPGGSSGGSGAAVASGEVPLALGSDTGGSVRCPASFTGVYGLKPSYGLVSRYGLVEFSNSIEVVGALASTSRDLSLLFSVIRNSSSPDPLDQTSVFAPLQDIGGIEGMEFGLLIQTLGKGVDPEVESATYRFADEMKDMGGKVEEVSLPEMGLALPAYYLLVCAEASSNLATYDGIRYGMPALLDARNWNEAFSTVRGKGFGPEVKRRVMMGSFELSSGYYDAYYLKALKVRTLIKRDFDRAFGRYDVLVTPTSPTLPFRKGERTMDPVAMYMSDLCTLAAPLAGIPALSLTCGFVDDLPVGLQLMGPPFGEPTILRVAHAYEQKAGHWRRQAEGDWEK